MRTYNAVIFDMDGTVLNNMGMHSQAWIAYLARQGRHITPEQFRELGVGHTNAEILRLFLDKPLAPEDILRMSREKEALYREMIRPQLHPIEGLRELLARLKESRVRIALATSAPHENIRFHMNGMRLEGYFEEEVGEEDVQRGKPAPDLFLEAARRIETPPSGCLVFEDSPIGLEAARRAGMDAVAITTTNSREFLAGLPGVIQVIDTYKDLPASFPAADLF